MLLTHLKALKPRQVIELPLNVLQKRSQVRLKLPEERVEVRVPQHARAKLLHSSRFCDHASKFLPLRRDAGRG